MLDQRVENLIAELKNQGFEEFIYRFPWTWTEDEGTSCLAWEPSILFEANCKAVNLYKSNITGDYLATIEMYNTDKSIDEVRDKFEKRLCGEDSPILFNSRKAEITSVTKGKDIYYINIKYNADDYFKVTSLLKFVMNNLPEIKRKLGSERLKETKDTL